VIVIAFGVRNKSAHNCRRTLDKKSSHCAL